MFAGYDQTCFWLRHFSEFVKRRTQIIVDEYLRILKLVSYIFRNIYAYWGLKTLILILCYNVMYQKNSKYTLALIHCGPFVPIQTWLSSILNVSRTLLPDLLYMPASGCGGSGSRRASKPGRTSSGLPYLSSTVLCTWHYITLSAALAIWHSQFQTKALTERKPPPTQKF